MDRRERVDDVLHFWFGEAATESEIVAQKMKSWFTKDAEFDRAIRERFLDSIEAAGRGELDDWIADPRSRLALVLVLDQFPRNVFRGTPRAFEFDSRAAAIAADNLKRGDDHVLRGIERAFMYLPFEHAENLELQETGLRAYDELLARAPEELKKVFQEYFKFAVAHRDIIARFGRFPHRNAILGRTSTPEEIEFLKEPGSSF
jgi:uncharacterized protein (DUF924 family)